MRNKRLMYKYQAHGWLTQCYSRSCSSKSTAPSKDVIAQVKAFGVGVLAGCAGSLAGTLKALRVWIPGIGDVIIIPWLCFVGSFNQF